MLSKIIQILLTYKSFKRSVEDPIYILLIIQFFYMSKSYIK
jgi:hypothetical protein